jgi:hypothetical protein
MDGLTGIVNCDHVPIPLALTAAMRKTYVSPLESEVTILEKSVEPAPKEDAVVHVAPLFELY